MIEKGNEIRISLGTVLSGKSSNTRGRRKMFNAIQHAKQEMSSRELAHRTGVTEMAARTFLRVLAKEGLVTHRSNRPVLYLWASGKKRSVLAAPETPKARKRKVVLLWEGIEEGGQTRKVTITVEGLPEKGAFRIVQA